MNRIFFAGIQEGSLLFERFLLVRCISAGDYSGVYLCNDKGRDMRRVVLKVVSKQRCGEQALVDRFIEEIRITQKIDHPNILKGDEWMSDDQFIAYSMEYIEGGSLADLLENHRSLSINQTINILTGICKGVEAIHEAGVVHRDLKPENILLTERGQVKICDFGIAANMTSPDTSDKEVIIGSLNYLSPEYLISGKFDRRSDIYSIGVIAYEMLTGKVPFCEENLIETLKLRIRFTPDSPKKFRPDIPQYLERLIMKALQKTPENRFQGCAQMLKVLSIIQDAKGIEIEETLLEKLTKLLGVRVFAVTNKA